MENMKENDELLEEDLELILGGTPKTLDKELNIIAASDKPIEEKKKLINELKHRILTGKIDVENTSNSKKR